MGLEELKKQLAAGTITKEEFAAELKKLLDAGTVTQEAHDAEITASNASTDKPGAFTDEQMKQIELMLQSTGDKVRTKAAAEKKALEDQLEKFKTDKMTDDEKTKHNHDKLQKDLADRETALNARIVELHIVDKLGEAKLPLKFKSFLVGATTDAADENIAAFASAWQSEIAAAVEAKFKDGGTEPPGGKGGGSTGAKKWNELNLTEQSKLYTEDQTKARSLALAAGVVLK